MKKVGIVEILESKLDTVSMIEAGLSSKIELEVKKKTVPRFRECLVPAKALLTEGCELVVIPVVIEEVDTVLKSELDKNIIRLELETGKHIFLHVLDFEEVDQKNEKKMEAQVMEFISGIVEYTLAFILDDKGAMKKIIDAEKAKKEVKKDSGDLI